MCSFYLITLLCGLTLKSVSSHPHWNFAWGKTNYGQPQYVPDSHKHNGWPNPMNRQDHDPHYHHEPEYQEYVPDEDHGCSCFLYVNQTRAFQRYDPSGWYSCNRLGLYRCSQFCDRLFQDQNLQYRGRQDACDTVGRDVRIGWHRRHQVCGGAHGLYKDILLENDLCCVRGRTSNDCEQQIAK